MVFLRRATGATAGGQSGMEEALPDKRFLGQTIQKPPVEETSTAQGIEQIDAGEMRQLFAQLRHEIHSAQSMQGNTEDESDANWFFDEWVSSPDSDSSKQATLILKVDRPIVVQSLIVAIPSTGGGGTLYIGQPYSGAISAANVGYSRLMELSSTTITVFQGIQMILQPTDIIRAITVNLASPNIGFYIEAMGAYMRNSQWRKF